MSGLKIPEPHETTVDSIEITTMTGCPIKCTICPQTPLKKNYKSNTKYLSLENFKLAISTLPKDILINFAGYSEPFANKDAIYMIEYALEQGYAVALYSTLYKVDMELAKKIVELKRRFANSFCRIFIHLKDASDNMPGLLVTSQYLSVLEYLESNIDSIMCMTMDVNNKAHKEIKALQNSIVDWIFHSRAGTLVEDNEVLHQKNWKNEWIIECTKSNDLKTGVLLPNGDVSLCCMDFGLKHIIGNLFTQTYNEIQSGEPLAKIKESNNTPGFHTDVLCRTCQEACDKTPWNDSEVYDLVKRIDPDSLGLG
jgi:hypothetical protein